jgi:cation/acetate symporter
MRTTASSGEHNEGQREGAGQQKGWQEGQKEVALAFAVAASANLPILFSLYWRRRFNTRGALWSMYGGLISCIVLIIFSPAVSGTKTAMLPGEHFNWFPLTNPGIVSIPLAFVLGIVGTLTSRDTGDLELNAEMEGRRCAGASVVDRWR